MNNNACEYCASCDSCNYCDYCNYCNYCYSCNSCNSCNYCDYCNYCNYCYSCDYCNYCNYCYSCDYCKNLKMTEYNYFCWSEKYNDDDSFQQKRYRVFNTEITEDEYDNIKKIYHKLEFDKSESYTTCFKTAFKKMWATLTQEEKQEYYDIPHFDWYGFTFITGVEREDDKAVEETSEKEIITLNGKKYKLVEE